MAPKKNKRLERDDFLKFLDEISNKKLGSKTFGEEFEMYGVPAFWMNKIIFKNKFLPLTYVSIQKLLDRINSEKKPGNAETALFRSKFYLLKKAIFNNELLKRKVSKRPADIENRRAEKDILFVIYTNCIKNEKTCEVSIITNLLRELKRRKVKASLLTFDLISRFSYNKLRDMESLVYGYIKKSDIKEVKEKSARLAKKWKQLDRKTKNEIFSHNGVGLLDYIEPQLDMVFSKEMLFVVYIYYRTIERMIKDYKVKATFLGADNHFVERAALAASNKHKIPCIIHFDGVGMGSVDYPEFKNVRFLAFGNNQKHNLIERGFEEKNIEVVGCLRFDDLKAYARKKKHFASKKKNILFVTQAAVEKKMMDEDTYFNNIERFLKVMDKPKNCSLTIKIHPIEKHMETYRRIGKKLKEEPSIIRKKETIYGTDLLYDLINKSDLIVTFKTSVILMGMLLDKPIVSIDFLDQFQKGNTDAEFIDRAVTKVSYKSDFSRILERILYEKNVRKKIIKKQNELIKDYLYRGGGTVYKGIADSVEELVRFKNRQA